MCGASLWMRELCGVCVCSEGFGFCFGQGCWGGDVFVSGDFEECSGGFGGVVRGGSLSVVHLGY